MEEIELKDHLEYRAFASGRGDDNPSARKASVIAESMLWKRENPRNTLEHMVFASGRRQMIAISRQQRLTL